MCSLIVPKSDSVQEIFNCSRISYLESIPTVLIIGHDSMYFVTHCRVTEGNTLEYLPAKSKGGQQHTTEQKSTSPSGGKNTSSMASFMGGGGFGLTNIVSQGLKGLRQVVSNKSKSGDEQKSLLSMTLIHLLEEAHYYVIPLSAVTEVIKRRTHHEPSALEISLENGKGLLLTILDKAGVMNEALRNKAHRMLTSCSSYVRNSESSATISDLTHLWRNRLLTNFDYILAVNSYSGRTFLDLNQYPVFPWVISDYTSDTIRLSDQSIYRNLSKPMAGLDEKRSSSFARRYTDWSSDDCGGVPKFHCGSHYSTPMMVLWYLTRLQPYTSMAVIYQGGKLDLADRLFHSIADAWHSASQGSNTDVKELIPELFYAPEFLKNHNSLNLGTNRDGELLGDVVLPPWASSAEHFIAVQREALESEYVSNNLNEWLDLIWGFAQSGEEAAKRLNVFFYLAYPGGLKKGIFLVFGSFFGKLILVHENVSFNNITTQQLRTLTLMNPLSNGLQLLKLRSLVRFLESCGRRDIQRGDRRRVLFRFKKLKISATMPSTVLRRVAASLVGTEDIETVDLFISSQRHLHLITFLIEFYFIPLKIVVLLDYFRDTLS